jgi:hypothetical protein
VSGGAARWPALGLWTLTGLAVVPTVALAAVNEASSVRDSAFSAVLILAFSSAGALVASRRPENPIGWLFLSGALVQFSGELALEYAVYALFTAPGSLPAAGWAGWFGGWARGIGWSLVVVFPLLLFPTGGLPSPRWRPALWAAVAFVVFFTLVVWLAPVSEDLRLASVGNPLGIDWEAMNAVREVQYVALLLLLLVCGASVVARFRGSRGDERQQLKWFAYAVAVMVVLFAWWLSLTLAGIVVPGVLMWVVPLLGLPVGVGIAVLRYRLYDIDVVISRTLVYGSLTVSLALIYAGSVASLQYALRVLTGTTGSQLVVVASTLFIAALFSPMRRRIQALIDRRFYRSRYDARLTLEAYAAKLREGTDLDELDGELVSVVSETMRPALVSLWLREPGGKTPRDGGP